MAAPLQVDSLTGIPSRHAFMASAERAGLEARHSKAPLAVLFIDIDGMKSYNDEHGHVAGDSMLAKLADLLDQLVRPMHLLGRLGGDEFVVLGALTMDAGQCLAESVRAEVELQMQPLTVTVGVAARPSGTVWGAHELLGLADMRAQHARGTRGRNLVATQALPASWMHERLRAAGHWPSIPDVTL